MLASFLGKSDKFLPPGHEPDKLIKADVPVPVGIDHVHHVVKLLLGRLPAKGLHHLYMRGKNLKKKKILKALCLTRFG